MQVFPYFIHKGGERIFVYAYSFVLQKGREDFDEFWHVYLLTFVYMFIELHCIFICLFAMHELRGSFFEALL